MEKYTEKNFNIKNIPGISKEQLEVHLGLYKGYVTNLNALYERLEQAKKSKDDAHGITSLARRIGFELAGIHNHEIYFEAIQNDASPLKDSKLKTTIEKTYGSFDAFIEEIKYLAKTIRGIGWIMVTYDKERDLLHTMWVADHELGAVAMPGVFVVDMWEHAFMVDYKPSEKGTYVDAYLNAVDWGHVSERFDRI